MNENNSMPANLVASRGNRCTATILSQLERIVKPQISDGDWQEVRRLVLDQVNVFKDLCIDIVKSDSGMINDFWVEKLDQIHDEIRGLRVG